MVRVAERLVWKIEGKCKASYRISFADSFALAQAKVSSSVLLTSDHHEFDIIESKEDIDFAWVR